MRYVMGYTSNTDTWEFMGYTLNTIDNLGESENMLGHGLPQDMAILIGKMMISDGIWGTLFQDRNHNWFAYFQAKPG